MRLLLSFFVLCSAFTAIAQDEALRLDVYSSVTGGPAAAKEKGFILELRSFVTNIGKVPLTIPTSTPSGFWSHLVGDGQSQTITLSIGFSELGSKKTKVVSSPFRHFPVELLPGEATELPKEKFWMPTADALRRITVVFDVDADFAKRFGWWSGKLRAVHVVGEDDSPSMEKIRPPQGNIKP